MIAPARLKGGPPEARCNHPAPPSRPTFEQGVFLVDEPDGFRDFVASRSRPLLRSAWLLTGDWALAEDLVQTALASTWMRWPRIVRRDAPELYVRRVMVSTYLSWTRRRWRGELPPREIPEVLATGDVMADADLRESLRLELDRLPRRQRAVLVLR